MPTAASVFDRCFKQLGGRLKTMPGKDVLLGPEWFKRRFWDYLAKLQASELYGNALGDGYLDYIDNPTLNAVVSPSEDLVLFGLFLGAVDNLSTFFHVVLSHPEVFPDVGDPGEQSKWFEDLSAWDWNLSLALAWQSYRSLQDTTPPLAKGLRSVFAGHLLMFALDFVFFHEVGHWCNGHDRFATKIRDQLSPFIDELTRPAAAGADRRVSRPLSSCASTVGGNQPDGKSRPAPSTEA
jgi:hypothetical protein